MYSLQSTCAALLCATLVLHAQPASALKTVEEWVTAARSSDGAFRPEKTYTIKTTKDCTSTLVTGTGEVFTPPIVLPAGQPATIQLCSADQPDNKHYFTSEELFAASAFYKASASIGYVKADLYSGCEAKPGGCCTMDFVPVVAGTYKATDSKCLTGAGGAAASIFIEVTGDAGGSLEQATSKYPFKPASERDASVQEAASSSWPGWATATEIELTLVTGPKCNVPAAVSRRMRRLLEDSDFMEGDASEGPPMDLMWVYSGGHSGLSSTIGQGSAGLFEGGEGVEAGEGAGTEGVEAGESAGIEGVEAGEGAGTEGVEAGEGGAGRRLRQSPGPDEGADGVIEGQGEGVNSPGPDEGADGVIEGKGEGATPGPNEGADGTFEGMGEGAVAPSSSEGLDGVYEGNGEGIVAAAPGSTEGEDGTLEGQGEGLTAASPNAPILTGEFAVASESPIEMVVNQAYKLKFNLLRSSGTHHYFSAPKFFASCVVRKIEANNVEFKFATYPLEAELYSDTGNFEMYVVPTVTGDYEIKSGNLPSSALKYGKIKVISGKPKAIDSGKTVTIATGACPPGEGLRSNGAASQSYMMVAVLAFVTLFMAV